MLCVIQRYLWGCILILSVGLTTSLASSLPIHSVVKVYASSAESNYQYPWQASKIINYTGSGAIIKRNKILTAAHVVSGAKFIQVQKENDPYLYTAKLKFISHQADLALLEVSDMRFFSGTRPLSIKTEIHHRDPVTVLGYPVGGRAISTTTGVISRIEYQEYVWSKEKLLAIQIDAAINSGNSGGPVVNRNGQLVGIAMQYLSKAENIGYIIPSIVVKTFLDDVKDGKVDGFHSNSTRIRDMANKSMREHYNVSDRGMLITHVDIEDIEFKPYDVLLSIDGKSIANDGTIETEFGRISYELALHTKQVGDIVSLELLRHNKKIEIAYTLKYATPLINHEFGQKPRYLIFGGLVFSPLTNNYLTNLKYTASAIDMLFYHQGKTKELMEPVVWLQTIFPHEANRGYYSGADIVETVNGIKIKNFAHFVELIEKISTDDIVIDFVEKKQIVMNVKEARDSFKELQMTYGLMNEKYLGLESKEEVVY